MEEWKDIKGYEGIYKISNMGKVRSYLYPKVKYLKERFDARGYVQYVLYNKEIKKSFKGHHLVWDHFGEGKRNGRIVNIDHKDEIKNNNFIGNLQLLTNRENLSKGKLKRNKSSKYTGVYRPKKYTKFQAYISLNKKHIFLGSYDTEEQASEAYQTALRNHNESF